MRQSSWVFALICTVAACGGKHKSAKQGGEFESLSEGSKCIEEARTPRQPPVDAPNRMDLGQILVRHAGVRDAKGSTRTREEACIRAQEARQQLLNGSDWDTIYKEYSDSQGATQGVLYDVTQGSLDEAFGNAAFSLQVDELSYVVESKRGFHVIWRKK
ncbi:MAG: peptidylprolyl isomerase [Polyangiaceae bacterium]